MGWDERIENVVCSITGKRIVRSALRVQTESEIYCETKHDLLHELGHWLCASPEERKLPNLGFESGQSPFEAMREFQAICCHMELAKAILPEDLEYVEFLMEASMILIESHGLIMSPDLQLSLARWATEEPIRMHRSLNC